MEFPIRNTIRILNTRFKTSLATTHDLPNQVEPIHTSHNSHIHAGFPISLSHNSGSPRVYHLFRATTQGMPQQALHLRYHPKHCRTRTNQLEQPLVPYLSTARQSLVEDHLAEAFHRHAPHALEIFGFLGIV